MAKIRARKDGGCSICYASDENVGKRRCCHVLDGADMHVRQEKGVNFIDLDGESVDGKISISIKASSKMIKNYITSLSDGLTKEEKDEILEAVRGM